MIFGHEGAGGHVHGVVLTLNKSRTATGDILFGAGGIGSMIRNSPLQSELASPWDFNDQNFLTPPRGVLFLAHTIKILISQSGICRFSLETGCTHVETQAHARVLGL